MTCVTCDVPCTGSLFVRADILLSPVGSCSVQCLPDSWTGAGNTPSVLPGILRGNVVLIRPDALHKRRKFSTVPTQRATCRHLQTLFREGGHRELRVSVFGSEKLGRGAGPGKERRERIWMASIKSLVIKTRTPTSCLLTSTGKNLSTSERNKNKFLVYRVSTLGHP